MWIAADGTFNPDPLQDMKDGDHVCIHIPRQKDVTIAIGKIEVDPGGGGGGPIIITSY